MKLLGCGKVLIDINIEHRHRPPVLATREQIIPIVVDLPAPLGPSSAKNRPVLPQTDAFEGLKAIVVDLAKVFNSQCWYHRRDCTLSQSSAQLYPYLLLNDSAHE